VFPKTPLRLVHGVWLGEGIKVVIPPKFGPMKVPEVDTPVAVNPDTGPSSAWVTAAVKVVIPAVSTNTSSPFRYDWFPVKPLSKKPSLIVGSAPM
jgi:hypothetical protein